LIEPPAGEQDGCRRLNLPANYDLTIAATNRATLDASVETLAFE
jgi:hypothetical protein